MGLKGRAVVTGVADYKNVRKYTGERKFFLEQWAELTQLALVALADTGLSKQDVDVLEAYDCYTITVLLTIENAGFSNKGESTTFVNENDQTF